MTAAELEKLEKKLVREFSLELADIFDPQTENEVGMCAKAAVRLKNFVMDNDLATDASTLRNISTRFEKIYRNPKNKSLSLSEMIAVLQEQVSSFKHNNNSIIV